MALFVDAATGWKGGSLILDRLRVEKAEVTQTVFNNIVQAIHQNPAHNGVLEDTVWNFSDKTTEFYTFLMPRLTGELASLSNGMCKEAGGNCNGRNGFELYRLVCKEVDAVFGNADFHVEVEIQRLGEKRCKSLEETRDLVRRLDTKAKECFDKVGCQVSGKLLAKSFWQAMDEHTLELAENRDLEPDCYKELREFTLQRF